MVSNLIPHVSCDNCTTLVSSDRTLTVEDLDDKDTYSYLSQLERGGLCWPTDLSVTIIKHIFQIFTHIIGNADLEKRFLDCKNQHKVLIKSKLFFCFLLEIVLGTFTYHNVQGNSFKTG